MLTAIIEKQYISKDKIKVVEKADINHISNVYRLGIGDQVRVIDGEYEYLTKIIELSKKEIVLEVEQKNEDIYSLNVNIDIALGILKNDKMNLAIQKLTEIGIRKIVPLHTERVIVKLNEKKEKWETIANETLKQCKGVKFTEVSPISKFKDIDYKKYDKILYAYENSNDSKSIHEVVSAEDKNVLYIIGPEGGITIEEVLFLKEKGAIEISLGKRILRAETAAIGVGGALANIYK